MLAELCIRKKILLYKNKPAVARTRDKEFVFSLTFHNTNLKCKCIHTYLHTDNKIAQDKKESTKYMKRIIQKTV